MRAGAGRGVAVVLRYEAAEATDRHLVLVEREACDGASGRAAHREVAAYYRQCSAAIVVGEQAAGLGGADTARPHALVTHQGVALLTGALGGSGGVDALEVGLHRTGGTAIARGAIVVVTSLAGIDYAVAAGFGAARRTPGANVAKLHRAG